MRRIELTALVAACAVAIAVTCAEIAHGQPTATPPPSTPTTSPPSTPPTPPPPTLSNPSPPPPPGAPPPTTSNPTAPTAAPTVPDPATPLTTSSGAHPAMPWSGYTPDMGEPLRYITMPAQPVAIETFVPMPGSLPSQLQPQVVEIPGYVITETTTGFYVPERWTLVQRNVGVYQWQQLPAEFRRK